MPRISYTSDPHLGHRFMARLRGFGETDEAIRKHDDTLIANFKKAAPARDDQLWILGDLCMTNPAYALERLSELQCELHLVLGNHDVAHPMHSRSHREQAKYFDVFKSVQSAATHKIEKRKVLLSHFPYGGDHTIEARYMQWRLRDEGEWLLHGHTHSSKILDPEFPKSIHVGVDAWKLMPVAREMIVALITTLDDSGIHST